MDKEIDGPSRKAEIETAVVMDRNIGEGVSLRTGETEGAMRR